MEIDATLEKVLEEARFLGFLGPGPVAAHIEHAAVFVEAYERNVARETLQGRLLDLGSGGGIPGLVLAIYWPQTRWVLLDVNERRTAFLQLAVNQLDIADRVLVQRGRAEELARESTMREQFDVVTARGFAPPAVTAECAVGFLKEHGFLIVSEPPEGNDRWNPEGLDEIGFQRVNTSGESAAVMQRIGHLKDKYPRRTGIPAKRPIF